jgi:hypothetical protein
VATFWSSLLSFCAQVTYKYCRHFFRYSPRVGSITWHDNVLLLGKQLLEVLVLTFEGLVFRVDCSLLLFQFPHNFFQLVDLIPFLNSGSDGTLSVLKTLTCFLVSIWILFIAKNAVFVPDNLLEVLLFFLGQVCLFLLKCATILYVFFTALIVFAGDGFGLDFFLGSNRGKLFSGLVLHLFEGTFVVG